MPVYAQAMSMVFEGVHAFDAALERMVAAADAAGREIVTKGGHIIEAKAKRRASGRPGPNVITGSHRRSFTVGNVVREGFGVWRSDTGPTMIYSRRLELGFQQVDSSGRVFNTPAYPSLGPGLQDARTELQALARDVYGRSLRVA